MTDEVVPRSAARAEFPPFEERGWRWGQLLTLLGLTGFAVSQPLLAVAGDNPSVFTFAGVRGWGLVAFALVVALAPPLVLWGVVSVAGLADRRAGDGVFLLVSGLLAGATAIQWAKVLAGIDSGWLLAVVGAVAVFGFVWALVRVRPVALLTRFTAVLPVLSVVLLLVASPAGDLLRPRAQAPNSAGGTRVTGDPPSVVFIMLDELPLKTLMADDGTIDEVRFPNFAALAADSTWYRDYTVQANATLQSVPSILTGRTPTNTHAIWTAQPDNLFSLLAPTHDLNVVEVITQLCGFTNCDIEGAEPRGGRGVRHVLNQMADVWRERVALRPIAEGDLGQFAAAAEPLDPGEVDWAEVPDGFSADPDAEMTASEIALVGELDGWMRDHNVAAPASVIDFTDVLHGGGPPSLDYLHLMLPHQPWMRYPDGRTFAGWGPLELAVAGVELDDWVRSQLNQVHLFQTMYVDRLLGGMLDRLKEEGGYDESLVVVTADHGVGFGPRSSDELRQAHPDTMSAIAYVPLMVKAPGQQEGRIDDSNLWGVDLLPTLAAELGVEIPWAVDGVPAGDPAVADRGRRKVFYDFGFEGRDEPDVITSDTDENRPAVANRAVGSVEPGEHSLAALARTIDADRWLGEHIEELDPSPGAQATLSPVDGLRGEGDRSPGLLVGELGDPADDGLVLLVVDGEVQSVAPVPDGQRFVLLIPPEVRPHPDLEVQLLEVRDNEVSLLDLGS